MAARPSRNAVSAMLPFYHEMWGTLAAPHQGGYELITPISDSYAAIYKLLGASPADTFIFTASGAEAINQLFHSVYWGRSRDGGANEYIVAATSEAPLLMCVSRLEELGCRGILIAPSNGIVTVDLVKAMVTSKTALVSLSWADGLTGIIQPIDEVIAFCRSKSIPIHLDITHTLGKLPCETSLNDVDYLTFNGEQLHAPQCSGGLLFREGAVRHPLIVGGIEQAGLRAGNLNVPGLVALAVASREALEFSDYICTTVAHLRHTFEEAVAARCPDAKILFSDYDRLPHIAVIAFPGIVNEALLFALHRRKLYSSIGGGSFQQLALVLESCGIPPHIAHSSLSFSLSRDTTAEEITAAVDIIATTVNSCQTMM